ncbi:MAG TPA: hypothetical protein VK589_12645, partial [Chryseolinea sp.]|nr:hypothetical protein [Chryseolinea sp.]
MRNYIFLLLLSAYAFLSCSTKSPHILSDLSTLPDTVPQIFAKGIISTKNIRQGAITFSPDMKEIFFTSVDSTGHLRIMEVKYSNKLWTRPREWVHSDKTNNYEPYISPDGRNLYFVSDRHAPNVKGSGRVWISSRVNSIWTAPKMLELGVHTQKGLWFPTVSDKGTLFFGAYLDSIGNYGKSDLYYYTLKDPSAEIINLG